MPRETHFVPPLPARFHPHCTIQLPCSALSARHAQDQGSSDKSEAKKKEVTRDDHDRGHRPRTRPGLVADRIHFAIGRCYGGAQIEEPGARFDLNRFR